ncbi:hypothetical protein sscle_11g080970 [Sclerotinia sclerotiorum 1980 UF-70]|uniref:Cyclase n=1 Tax=Sclerotinia sclerotiorum (strain ATCC 18683 / 1980 / Ss-1) TaxID=665079 RepID=A0A1D9QEG8_SCLS1|nr:hypothetical protein sscle_11g080970 [Sclerotinia sclerotiorum 1980 UF-70]
MTSSSLPPTPPFSSLPLQSTGPRGNAWGLYGPSDELGCLNRLTPENTIEAAKEIKHGIRISTDWALDKPKVPCFGRVPFKQKIIHKSPRSVNDDELVLNTQCSSQWDGFRHFGYQDHKTYFNGCTQEEIHNSTRNGINVWVENGGIVGRGVLLDYAHWVESQGRTLSPLTTTKIPLSEIKAVAKAQNVTFRPGDILFIRTGYLRAFEALSPSDASALATAPQMTAIGLEACKEVLEWLWEKEFSAVAGDQTAFESLPFDLKNQHWMHEWLLAGWGMPMGELFDLERLGEECRRYKKWTFFFSSVPLKVPGGVASPPNGVAIL